MVRKGCWRFSTSYRRAEARTACHVQVPLALGAYDLNSRSPQLWAFTFRTTRRDVHLRRYMPSRFRYSHLVYLMNKDQHSRQKPSLRPQAAARINADNQRLLFASATVLPVAIPPRGKHPANTVGLLATTGELSQQRNHGALLSRCGHPGGPSCMKWLDAGHI